MKDEPKRLLAIVIGSRACDSFVSLPLPLGEGNHILD